MVSALDRDLLLPRLLISSLVALALFSCNRPANVKPEPVAPRVSEPAAPKPSAPTSAKPSFPSRFELYRTLLANADLPLAKASHCDSVIGADAGPSPTLGDWVAYNLSVLENGAVTLPTECRAEGSARRCRVEFAVRNDAEGVLWRWGVDFALRPDGALDRGSVMCTGAG